MKLDGPPLPSKPIPCTSPCSPELGAVSYGHCQDEALNNLTDEIREQAAREELPPKGNADGIE